MDLLSPEIRKAAKQASRALEATNALVSDLPFGTNRATERGGVNVRALPREVPQASGLVHWRKDSTPGLSILFFLGTSCALADSVGEGPRNPKSGPGFTGSRRPARALGMGVP